MSSSDANIIASLNYASMQISRYLGLFVFGIMGNIINVFVLFQRPLRSNSCAWFFLVSSIANSIGILAGLTTRILSTWPADLTNTSQFLCKFRTFFLFDGLTIGPWLIALATVDRWLSSHIDVNRRQLSSLRNAQRGTMIIVILSSIFEIQQLFCFEANITNGPLKCYTRTVLCSILGDLSFALVTILFPLAIMFIFGLMTVFNVKKVQSCLQPRTMNTNNNQGHDPTTGTTENTSQRKKTDGHLLIMLLFQVLLMFLLTFPFAISKICTTITRYMPKSSLDITIENFIFGVFLLSVYVAAGLPFYIYIVSGGSVFRKAVYSLLETVRKKLMCCCN